MWTFQPNWKPVCSVRDDDQRRGRDRHARGSTPSATSARRHRALADAEQRQPDDQQRADRAQRIAVPAAAVGPRRARRPAHSRAIATSAEHGRDLEPAEAARGAGSPRGRSRRRSAARLGRPARLAITRRPRPAWRTVRNFSGATRIAAPVGQARTQAGPPSIPEHMSHLIAFLGFSTRLRRASCAMSCAARPGPGPAEQQPAEQRAASSAARCPCGSRHRGSCAGNCRSRCRCRR